jgi:surface antigen
MRAERSLAAVFVLFCAVATAPSAEAAEENRRQPQATRQVAASQALRSTARMPQATIAPQRQVASPMMRPVVARGAAVRLGTPILPVAATTGLSCVPFVRMATGMTISGDARLWWHNAAAQYARGQMPERGAVLAFMASGGMSRGHVAVVSRVVNDRTILIDHSNWAGPGIRRGTVMRGVTVLDVSDRNDWTAVRVQVGHSAEAFGRTYPTHGFIYNRPAGTRMMMASLEGGQEVAEAQSPHTALHLRLASEALADWRAKAGIHQ